MLYAQRGGGDPFAGLYRRGVIKQDLGGEYDRRVSRSETARSPFARFYWAIVALLTPVTLDRRQADCWAEDDQAPYLAERRELSERIREAFDKRRKGLFGRRSAPPSQSSHLRSA
jgi:hypothetical protein